MSNQRETTEEIVMTGKRKIRLFFLVLLIGFLSYVSPPARAELPPQFSNNLSYAWKLFSEIQKEPGNIAFSPFSIEEALGICAFGARGKTLRELNSFLEFEPEAGDLRLSALAKEMKRSVDSGQITFHLANGLFLQKGHLFEPSYLEGAKARFLAEVQNVDFAKDVETARTTINDWVSGVTVNKIPELLARGILQREQRMVIANAIYLKAEWDTPFQKSRTEEREFFPSDGISQKIPFLQNTANYPYFENKDFQLLELPYKGRGVGLLLLLPKKQFALSAVTSSLHPQLLEDAFRNLASRRVQVSLPKFSTSSTLHLGRTLQSLGVNTAFQAGSADFSVMDGTKEIFLGDIIHKAVVELDEKGTVAAAATAVMALGGAAPPPVEEPIRFEANQPFLFAIREKHRGGILFLGRFESPN